MKESEKVVPIRMTATLEVYGWFHALGFVLFFVYFVLFLSARALFIFYWYHLCFLKYSHSFGKNLSLERRGGNMYEYRNMSIC